MNVRYLDPHCILKLVLTSRVFFCSIISEKDESSSDSEIVFENDESETPKTKKNFKKINRDDDEDSGGIVFAEKSFVAADEKVVPSVLV